MMAKNYILTQARDNNIRKSFTKYRKQNPKWTIIAVIEKTADDFYLSPATVNNILKKNSIEVPSTDTVIKYTRQQHLK